MALFALSKPFILLITIYFFVDFTKEDHVKFVSIANQISSTPFDTFTNQNDLNGAERIQNQPKSRRKRYVAFPEGSSFSVAACETIGLIGNPNYTLLTWALNWGLVYNLPNDTWILSQKNGYNTFPKPIVQRRHRRDLYSHLEHIIDNMGYNGRACVLRALCESSEFFRSKSTNMAEELIRTIFMLPTLKTLPFEHADLVVYGEAHHKGKGKSKNKDQIEDHCANAYSDCEFSLIALALGEYAAPPDFM